jgi:uncharacterized membrane protein YfcA
MQAITNRRLIKDDEKYKISLLDTNLISEQESAFSLQDLKTKLSGIFKKDNNDSSNNDSGAVKERSGAGLGIFTGLLGIAGSLAPILPSIGIGSKSRIAEAQAIAAANNSNSLLSIEAERQKAKELKSVLLIGGVLIFVIVIAAVALRK